MGFRDLFKEKPEKDKVHSNQSEDNEALDEIHFIIDALWDVDDKKQVVSHCKDAINFLLVEENVDRKTDLLLAGLELSLAQLQKAKDNPQTKLGTNCITTFIYYRHYLECVLALDEDITDILFCYTIFQSSKQVDPQLHPYIQTMIKIYDLLDRGIKYLYENMNEVTRDYFTIVASKIETMLSSYEDDDTGWNKINN